VSVFKRFLLQKANGLTLRPVWIGFAANDAKRQLHISATTRDTCIGDHFASPRGSRAIRRGRQATTTLAVRRSAWRLPLGRVHAPSVGSSSINGLAGAKIESGANLRLFPQSCAKPTLRAVLATFRSPPGADAFGGCSGRDLWFGFGAFRKARRTVFLAKFYL